VKGYNIAIPQPRKKEIPFIGVFYKHHGLNYFGLSYQKGIVNAHNYSIHM
jgi:hypothetical protein